MFMSSQHYRESLRRFKPTVYVNGRRVESVADDPDLAPGVAAIGLTYEYALREEHRDVMVATQHTTGEPVNRMSHICRDGRDLLRKLEAVRLLCRQTGCAQRYLTGDALNALFQSTYRTDIESGTEYHPRLLEYLHRVQREDLACAVAMTDAKGDRSARPFQQSNPDVYVHVAERRPDGIVISGTKAIVTGAPYVHEFLVMPCRRMTEQDKDFAVACAVPVDAPGVTIVARPAGRPGEADAMFSARFGQSVGVVIFDRVLVPWERVFLCGEWEQSGFLTTTYATQIYDMQRLAHDVSGGLVVALPGPEEDHNPATAGDLAAVLAGHPEIPAQHRMDVARLVEDLTASSTGGWYSVISLHGGGSPEAMKHEIYRRYPLEEKAAIVEQLLGRGLLAGERKLKKNRQPGRCCVEGCQIPPPTAKAIPAHAIGKPSKKAAS